MDALQAATVAAAAQSRLCYLHLLSFALAAAATATSAPVPRPVQLAGQAWLGSSAINVKTSGNNFL